MTDGVAEPPEPNDGESTVAGAGHLLGTNKLIAAAEVFDKAATSLTQGISSLNAALGASRATFNAGTKWTPGSNWPISSAPSGNGGNPTMNGMPVNGQAPTGSGTPNGGGGTIGGGIAGGVIAGAGFGWRMANRLNGALGVKFADKNRNLATSNTVSQIMNFGQMTNGIQSYLYGNPTIGSASLSTPDQFAGYLATQQSTGTTPGTSSFARMALGAAGISRLNPGMGFGKAASIQGSFYSAAESNMLRRVGVNTFNPNTGHMESVTSIANQILSQFVRDPHTVLSPDVIDELVYAPYSPMVNTLYNWMAAGALTPDQMQVIQSQIKAILQARAKGVSPSQLQNLLNNYKNGNTKARRQLNSMGLANSAIQDTMDKQAAAREKSVHQIGSFNKALRDVSGTLVKLNEHLQHLDSGLVAAAAGRLGAGQYLNGKVGMTTAGVTGLSGGLSGLVGSIKGNSEFSSNPHVNPLANNPLSFQNPISPWFNQHVTDPVKHWLGSLLGIGGGDDARMSIGHGGAVIKSLVSGVGGGGKSGGGGSAGSGKNNNNNGSMVRLIWPVHGPITNPFGAITPYDHGPHTGIDIACSYGTPIKAAIGGTVVSAGPTAQWAWAGNVVRIDSGDGFVTLYGHNSSVVVSVGQKVQQGQTIARAGSTGNSTGVHCHFEIDINGHPVNPMPYLSGSKSALVNPNAAGSTGPGGAGANMNVGSGSSFVSGIGASELQILEGASAGMGPGQSVAPAPGSSGSSGSGNFSGISGGGSSSQNVKLGQRMAAQMGWGSGTEWQDLYQLWMHESGWRTTARNPSSGAYGIAQALPPSKYNSVGHDWMTNPKTQIAWGLGYIKQRYGDPIHAWQHEMRYNWYDKGAWDIPKDEPAVVHKGEMIIPANQARQIREVLLHNQPFGANTTGGRAGLEGVILNFNPGSIRLSVGAGATVTQARSLGRAVVDTIVTDTRIKQLQAGNL